MSAECAILASGTEPVREVMTEDENGWMVDFFDREALVDRLCALLDDEATRKRLGANARAFVRENYDLKTVCLPQHLEWVAKLETLDPRPPQD